MNSTITAVAGLQAGHFTDAVNGTGCSVFLCREGAVGGVDVRGGSPGTRETDLLRPLHRVEKVHAITLSGGSAFGLEAASGVMSCLAEQGIGLTVGPGTIPIVASAILFDLGLLNPKAYPALTATAAATVAPLGNRRLAEPMPDFTARSKPRALPTVAPVPAPTLP